MPVVPFALYSSLIKRERRDFTVGHVTPAGHGGRVTFGSGSLDFTRNVGCSAEKRP